MKIGQRVTNQLLLLLVPWMLLHFFFFTSRGATEHHHNHDDPESEIDVSGPGWDDPSISLPSRYFFIVIPDGPNPINVSNVEITSIHGVRDRNCFIKTKVLKKESSTGVIVTVRYRLMSRVCRDGISITIFGHDNRALKKKTLTTPVAGEDYVCRDRDFQQKWKCDQDTLAREGVDRDFRAWRAASVASNFTIWLQDAVKRFASFPRSYSFCHYKIISNEIYKRCYGEYVGFSQFFDDMMKSLLRKTSLSDTQFLVNLGDWPLSSRDDSLLPIPFFSWCGSEDTHDIVLPTYEMTESVIHFQDRVSLDVLSILGTQNPTTPFEDKMNRGFFRGRDSNRLRLLLVLFSKEKPELIDAGLTNFFFFRSESELEKYGPRVPHVSFYDFFNYRYLISIDGTVAAYRFPQLLSGSSLVLKQKSKYYEHFYSLLQPGVHYIQLKDDISDIHSVMNRLMNTSDPNYVTIPEQKEIVNEANDFVRKHLLPDNIYCYYYQVVTQYTQQILSQDSRSNILIEPEDEHVTNSQQSCHGDKKATAINVEL